MSMTLEAIINAILPLTGAGYESDITRHINKGLLELAKESGTVVRDYITAVNGVAPLPEDCLIIKGVYVNGHELPRYYDNDISASVSGLSAEAWVKDGDNIVLIPKQNTNKTLQLAYIQRPELMENLEDKPSIRDAEEFLIAYATWKTRVDNLAVIDEVTNHWREMASNEYREWLNLNRKQENRPRRVRTRPWS